MKNYTAKSVDEYIANMPEEARAKLEELRAVIKSTVPKAEESIKWGIPFYMYHGMLGGFAAFKKHISFGMGMSDLDVEDRTMLEQKGYETGKKIIQIRFDQKIPVSIIKKIIKLQARINEKKK